MRRSSKHLIFLVFVELFWVVRVLAAPERNFGMGGMGSGRVGAMTAEPDNPFAADSNPALISLPDRPQFSFTFGGGNTSYSSPSGVLVDSPQYRTQSGTRDVVGNADLPSYGFSRWALGFVYPFSLSHYVNRRAGIGLSLSGPFSKIRNMVSETPYAFQAFRYGPSDEQLKAVLGASVELVPETLFFGAGASFYITASGAIDVVLLADNPTGRLEMEAGLNSSAILGLYSRFGDHGASLVYRQAVEPSFKQEISGRVQIAEGVRTMDIPWLLQTTLYYEPHQFELDYQARWGDVSFSAGVSYALWSNYKPSFFVATAERRGGERSTTQTPDLPLQDTLNPRASMKASLTPRWELGAGYQYRPSPLKDEALTSTANLMDSNTHILGLATQYRLNPGPLLPFPMRVGAFAQLHLFNKREVKKQNARYIGAPGYTIDGQSVYVGVSLGGQF